MCDSLIAYHDELRTALFLSSITIGTFIFTMKSFIVTTLKKEVFDSKAYKDRVKREKAIMGSGSVYKELRNLSVLLIAAVSIAFGNAILQITLGAVGACWSALLSLAGATVTAGVVGFAIFIVSRNLLRMIEYADEQD